MTAPTARQEVYENYYPFYKSDVPTRRDVGDVCERRLRRMKRAKRRGSGRNFVSVCEQKISGTATGFRALRKVLDRVQQRPPLRRAGSPEPAAVGIFDFAANHVEPRAAAQGIPSVTVFGRATSLKEGGKALRRGGAG